MDTRSKINLIGVHPDLVLVVKRLEEICKENPEITFVITEGTRTMGRQKELLKSGVTTTLKSRHVPENNVCGLACAFDIALKVNGIIRWDWPLYVNFSDVVKRAAQEVNVPIEWGGDWKKFKDGPHYQLPKSLYPEV